MVPPFEFTSFLVPNIILFFNMILVTINKLHPWWGGGCENYNINFARPKLCQSFPSTCRGTNLKDNSRTKVQAFKMSNYSYTFC